MCPGVQSGFPYEALVTFIMLPVFVGEVHIMCVPSFQPTSWILKTMR